MKKNLFKKAVALASAAFMTLSLAGCGNTASSTNETNEIKVAVIKQLDHASLDEIANAIIGKASGYPLWAVSNASSTFILLEGVSWELSMMFSLAGIISYHMMGDKDKRYFTFGGKYKGISTRVVTTFSMALLFALFESFLAGTSNGSFIWVYKWWGVLPVFITTYIPFFIASNYVNMLKPKVRTIALASAWGLVAILLAVLIPCGVI